MEQNRKICSETFKKEVAQEALKRGKNAQEVATENGDTPSMTCKIGAVLHNGEFSKKLKLVKAVLDAYIDHHHSFGYKKMVYFLSGRGRDDASGKRVMFLYRRRGRNLANTLFWGNKSIMFVN